MKGHPRLQRAAGGPPGQSQRIRMLRRSLSLTLVGPQTSLPLRRMPMVGLQSPASGGAEAQMVQNLRRVLKCCVLWVPFFSFFTQNGNLKACFYVSSSLAILMLYFVPLFPSPSLSVAFSHFLFFLESQS